MSERTLLRGLTPKQAEAVKTIDRDLEIIACAGAGKTKTVTLRIINLIAHGVDPENIVAITFTRKAAEEMRSRIYAAAKEHLGNNKGLAAMYIGTIDAFCLKMLQDYEPEFAKFSVLDEVQIKIFLERNGLRSKDETGLVGSVIDNAPNLSGAGKYTKKLDHYISLMSILNNCYYDRGYRDNWDEDTKKRFARYNKCLYDNRVFDYSSLIREMIERLDPDSDRNKGRMSDFGHKVFEKVKYLTIDEYQDSNPPQERLAELFHKYGNTNLCIVGDADQTIYQFRGSDEGNILGFAEKYNAKKIHLNLDFRSTEAIVDIAGWAIRDNHINDPDYVKMERGRVEGSKLEYETGDAVWAEFADFSDEADFICERINKLKDIGVPYSEMAVLIRTRKKLYYGEVLLDFQKALAAKLKDAEIPYIVEGLNNLHNTPEYAAGCELFFYIYNEFYKKTEPTDKEKGSVLMFAKTAAESGLSEEEKLKKAWLSIGEAYGDESLTGGLDRALKDISDRDWSKVKFGHDLNMQQIFQDFLGYLSFIKRDDDVSERILYNLGKFSRVIADFELMYFKESAEFKLSQFKRHLQLVANGLYPEGMEDNSYIKADAVRLMTIHQSKGLEFTAVFIPTMCNSLFPGGGFSSDGEKVYSALDAIDIQSEGNGGSWIPNHDVYKGGVEAERKLFYVAVSRAKKYLFLTWGKCYSGDYEKYIPEERSKFIDEVKQSDYLREYSDDIDYSSSCLPDMRQDPIPMVLNFSLLSNYFDCPYRFKLSNFYGFVQPYSSSQGYGKMLHEIMMHIHRSWIEGKELTDEQIDSIAEDALYLPFASKPQIEKSLAGAKKCAHAYVEQNKAEADKLVAAELDINLEMGNGVSVNGRIDLVKKIEEDGTDRVAIVDLKSAGKDAEQCLNAEQLKIYALGYSEMTGAQPDYLMIYNLDHPDGSKNAREEVRQEALVEVQRKVLKAADNIRGNELTRCVSQACKTCYVKEVCRGKSQ